MRFRSAIACLLVAALTVFAADVRPQSMPQPPAPAITALRALASDANGLPVASVTTATELGYSSGVTSAIQTQLNAKLPLAGGTLTGNLNLNTNNLILDTAGQLVIDDADGTGVIRTAIGGVPITRTQLGVMDLRLSDDGATAGPSLRTVRLSASPAVSDDLGEVAWYGKDSGAADQLYGRVFARIDNATAGSEVGQLRFAVQNGAAETLVAQAKITGWRLPYANATTVPYLDANKDLQSSTVTPTELAYLAGAGGVRVRLSGDRTYYVATTGNDSNDCLTVGTPCLTPNQAIALALRDVDTGPTANVLVQLADGTYTTGVSMSRPLVGGGYLIVQGNVGTPANVIISTTSADAIQAGGPAVRLQIKGAELRTTTAGSCIRATSYGSVVVSGALRFGACVSGVQSDGYGLVTFASNYTIAGNSTVHYNAQQGGVINGSGYTVTLSGTPAFSGGFASVLSGQIYMPGVTFSGSATGTRYSVVLNGVIFTNGGGANYFPGNVAGSTGTGGQYN